MRPRWWWHLIALVALFGWATWSTLVQTDGGANFAFVTAFMIAIPYGLILAVSRALGRRRATP